MRFHPFFALLVVFSHSVPSLAASVCPSATLGETPSDCPWASIARDFDLATNPKDLKSILTKRARTLSRHLAEDAAENDLKTAWGEAVNYDEYAKGIIVSPATLKLLARDFDVAEPRMVAESRFVLHAGLQHTYAYLFSNLKTPFGYKRARWVKNDIETGLGLSKRSIHPTPRSGTLFRNMTTLALKLIDLTDAKAKKPVDASISKLDPKKLKRIVLRETVKTEVAPNSDAKPALAQGSVLSTYLIEFKKKPSSSTNTHLLIYTLSRDGDLKKQKLITAFPVESSFRDQLADPTKLGDNQPIQFRYNAYHSDLYQKAGFRGVRTLSEY